MVYRNERTGQMIDVPSTISGGDWLPVEPAPADQPAEPPANEPADEPADEPETEPVEPAPAAAPAVGRRARNGG